MTKYNITPKKEGEPKYRGLIKPELMKELRDRLYEVIVVQQKYRDEKYSAKQLAEDLGTNTRYISAVVNVCYKMNYTSFVNQFRVEEAKALLANPQYKELNIEDISRMVGYANRQSFYASFFKLTGITPKEYKKNALEEKAAISSGQGEETKCAKETNS